VSILTETAKPEPQASQDRAAIAEPARLGPIRQVVMQPTPFCNMDCRYCYLPDRLDQRRMTPELAALALKRVFDSGWADEVLEIRWHAGEPLVVGPGFYRDTLARVRPSIPSGIRLRHTIQTNGTLVDGEWCRFFRDEGFEVGLSIDGPADLHDRNRVMRSGRPTHHAALKAADLLREHGVAFSVIAVLTRDSLDRVDEIYEFFAALGPTRVGFNSEEIEGINDRSSLKVPGIVPRLRKFLERFQELSLDGRVRCRELLEMRGAILHGEGNRPNWMTTPGSLLCVAWNGDLTGFSPELQGIRHPTYGSFVFGNVKTHSLEESLYSESFRRISHDIALGVAACKQECPYFGLCGGGAPSNKLAENGSFISTSTLYCTFRYKEVAEVVLATLEAELAARDRDRLGEPAAITLAR
jgi:uncharacterized protein